MKHRSEISKFVINRVKAISDEKNIHEYTHLYYTCGLDSLDVAEIMVDCQKEFNIKFKKEAIEYATIEQLIEEIYRNQ